jgi:flagellar basal-body rod protein FlgF
VLRELWVPLSGALAQQQKVDSIANNVANANTPGFKRDQLVFKEYLTKLEKGYDDIDLPRKEWAPADFYRSYGAENAKVKVDGSFTDFEQGQLTPTGNPFDLALQGDGFLEVLTPHGVRFTRKAILTLNQEGRLVTDQGHPVLSRLAQNDDPAATPPRPQDRTIQLPEGQFNVNLQGDIFINNQAVAQLSVVEFGDQHALKKEGASFYINDREENMRRDEIKTSVHQGFIEQSNVNAIAEMSELIKANRHFESIQRVIKTYDNISAKGVNEISRF